MLPVALGAIVLSACGSDTTSSGAGTSVAVSTATSSEFNDADVAFAQGMIPHHQQAVEMADLALRPEAAASAETIALATEIKNAQDPEIVLMTSWLQAWGKPVEMDGMDGMDGMAGMEGMMSTDEMTGLGALTGADFDRSWATMMIAHHEGAIAQSQTAKASGSNPDVLLLADQIIAAQQAEIDQMNALLAG